MAKAPINVSIAGDYNDKDINRAIRDLNSLKTGGTGTTTAMSGLSSGMKALGGVMAATFSVGLITDFFSNSISAALADEMAMKSLSVTMENVGKAHDTAAVEKFIDVLARQSGIADDVLRPSLQGLITVTGNVVTSQNALRIAMDVAAGTTKSVEEVSKALSAAYAGNFTAITRLKTGIDASIIATKDMDLITGALSDKFAGQAKAAAETYQGRLNRVSVAAGEASEQIGIALLGAIDEVATSMGGADGAADAVTQLGNGFAGLITQTSDLINLLLISEDATKATTVANKYSQTSYRQLVTLIPIVGTYLSTLSMFQEGQATAAGLAADANAVLSSRLQGLATDYLATANAANIYGRYVAAPDGKDWANFYAVNQSGSKALADAQNNVTELTEKYNESLLKVSGGAGSAAQATDTLTKAQERNAQKVTDQKTKTDAAIQTFNDYRDTVAESFNGLLDLGAAFDSFTERQTNLAKAQKELTDFQTANVGAATDSQITELAKLQAAYHDASESAAKGSKSVVEEFEAQGRKLQEFGANLSRLVAAGLGRRAFDAIRGMTAERGAEVSAALVDGMIGENVNRINSVYDSINTMAVGVGNQGAVAFEQVGFTMATAMIETLLTVVNGRGRARLRAMLDDLNGAMNAAAGGGPMPSGGGGGGSAAGSSGGALAGMFTSGAVTVGIPEISGINWAALGLPDPLAGFRAAGGPVSAGRSYMVGEAGPEIFTPKSAGSITPNSAMGGNTYNINVSAGVGDPRAIGQQIVEYVKKFEKANGPVFVAA